MNKLAASERPELSSNLHEIINRLENDIHFVRSMKRRLLLKNEQLVFGVAEKAPQVNVGSDPVTGPMPLIPALNEAILTLSQVLQELEAEICVTENI